MVMGSLCGPLVCHLPAENVTLGLCQPDILWFRLSFSSLTPEVLSVIAAPLLSMKGSYHQNDGRVARLLRRSLSGLGVYDGSKQHPLGNRRSNVAEIWAWTRANDITAVYDS